MPARTRSLEPMLALLALLRVFSACDGGAPSPGGDPITEPPRGREPEQAGTPLLACAAERDCPPGTACVLAVAGRGHCHPVGDGGGRCEGASCAAGLACAGKDATCVPVVGEAALCVAAACAAGLSCAAQAELWRCLPPGQRGARCRASAPACDEGLGCVTGSGICEPLGEDDQCFDGRSFFGCRDGTICPRRPGDVGGARARCGVPGAAGGPCGDPALNKPVCMAGLGCAGELCRRDAVGVGAACVAAPGHAPCLDGSRCEGGVCVPLGTTGRACRPAAQFASRCDEGLACVDERCAPRLAPGAACDPDPERGVPCVRGADCMPAAAGHVCVADGSAGGRCLSPSSTCDEGLVCAVAPRGGTVCVSGMPLGSRCTRDREPFEPCVEGAGCSLVSNRCEAEGTLGGRCGPGAICGPDLVCASQGGADHCFPVAEVVAPGQSCDTHPDLLQRMNRCADGLECVGGGCVAAGASGARCRVIGADSLVKGGRCDAGLACAGGRCVAGKPIGASCVVGSDGECAAPALCVGRSGQGTCQAVPDYDLQVLPRPRGPARSNACAGGTIVALSDVGDRTIAARDEGSARVPLPFPFVFYGQRHEALHVSSNGVAGFPPAGEFFNPGKGGAGLLPVAATPALIAPFWDDLVVGAPAVSQICHRTFGAPGDRQFIVTWRNLGRYGRTGVALTFSLVLHEAGGAIELHHDDLHGPGADAPFVSGVRAAIGLQAQGGVRAVIKPGPITAGELLRLSPRVAD